MTIDELRAKFEATFAKPPYEWSFGRVSENGAWPGHYCAYYKQTAWEGFLKGHASRDTEVEALKKCVGNVVRQMKDCASDISQMPSLTGQWVADTINWFADEIGIGAVMREKE